MGKQYEGTIRKFSVAEEASLIAQWKDGGDEKALNTLLKAYAPLINKRAHTAHRYYKMGIDDCMQTARIAFIDALRKFNPDLGYNIGTFVQYDLSSALALEAGKETTFKIPSGATSKRVKAYLKDEISKHNEFNMPLQTIFRTVAEKSGVSPSQVEEFYFRSSQASSLNRPVNGTDGELFLQDIIPDRNYVDPADLMDDNDISDILEQSMSVLNDKEKMVLKARFGFSDEEQSQTLKELGTQFGVSNERIRQIEVRAIEKMRKAIESSPQLAEALSLHL